MPEKIIVPGLRLGKNPSPASKLSSAFKLANYLTLAELPVAPSSFDGSAGITNWPMYANDSHGDCTCAAAGHMFAPWYQVAEGSPKLFTDADILALYALVNYGVDQGASPLDVLDKLRHVGLAGETVFAYASVDRSNHNLAKAALWLFYGLYTSIELPITAQTQDVWDVSPATPDRNAPGSWGGHEVNVTGYDDSGLTLITWGGTKRMTWAFWDTYVDEVYAVIPSVYERDKEKLSVNGFNFQQLKDDLLQVGPIDEGG